MTEENNKHIRRPHYSGKYPKRYEEKYKELNPEKYDGMAEHVIEKGSTPAGTHIPIMVEEVLEHLAIQPGDSGCDCTLGYGGHSRKILEALHGSGHLVSLDVDPEESAKTEKRLREAGFGPEMFSVEHINFAEAKSAAEKYGKFDFLMADLGVSSMQIDNPARGFSYKLDGPLDLRMDQSRGETAAERLKELDAEEIEGMLVENSDEPYAAEIAAKIADCRRKRKPVETTADLRYLIEEALPKSLVEKKSGEGSISETAYYDTVKKSCARVFQALRIDINGEYEALESLLLALPDVMKAGGRIVFLTFHSGEDRLVKRAFKDGKKAGYYSEIAEDVIRPSAEECHRNPRARSTKLRWAVRV